MPLHFKQYLKYYKIDHYLSDKIGDRYVIDKIVYMFVARYVFYELFVAQAVIYFLMFCLFLKNYFDACIFISIIKLL